MKIKYRLVVSFCVALALLFFALPHLPVNEGSIPFGFSLLWISFCLLVIGANLHALLRLGRGEVINKPALNKEQREALRRIQRYKPRRLPSR